MSNTIQLRRDTATNWTIANHILAEGEIGIETDTKKFKIGDGSTAWTSLPYTLVTTYGTPGSTPMYLDQTTQVGNTMHKGTTTLSIVVAGTTYYIPVWGNSCGCPTPNSCPCQCTCQCTCVCQGVSSSGSSGGT